MNGIFSLIRETSTLKLKPFEIRKAEGLEVYMFFAGTLKVKRTVLCPLMCGHADTCAHTLYCYSNPHVIHSTHFNI